MKTAEVAIEHVLTGLLALCAFLVPLLSGLRVHETLLQSEVLIGVLGLAYLFGVVFDRLADTILGPIEQWLRLRLADRLIADGMPRFKNEFTDDPFPQDVLEFSLRSEQGGRVDWMDSLRSRIRTSRGLAVFGFPAAMGIVIFLSARPVSQVRWDWWPHLAVAVNLILVFMAVVVSSRELGALLKALTTKKSKSVVGTRSANKAETNQESAVVLETLAIDRAGDAVDTESVSKIGTKVDLLSILKPLRTDELANNPIKRQKQMTQSTNRMLICSAFYLLMLFNSALTVATISKWPEQLSARLVIVVCAGIATALPLFVWYRITETHMSFIYRRLSELGEKKVASAL